MREFRRGMAQMRYFTFISPVEATSATIEIDPVCSDAIIVAAVFRGLNF
jgi:hypothetical protein